MSDEWGKNGKRKENNRRKGRRKIMCRGRQRKKERIITDGAMTLHHRGSPCSSFWTWTTEGARGNETFMKGEVKTPLAT